MFGIHESRCTTGFLAFCNRMQRECGFSAGFRAIDLDHPAPGQTADTQRSVQGKRTGGNDRHIAARHTIAHTHDGALAELPFNLCECCC